jgi:hypothetical protein
MVGIDTRDWRLMDVSIFGMYISKDVERLQPSHVSLSPLFNPLCVLIRRLSHASVL